MEPSNHLVLLTAAVLKFLWFIQITCNFWPFFWGGGFSPWRMSLKNIRAQPTLCFHGLFELRSHAFLAEAGPGSKPAAKVVGPQNSEKRGGDRCRTCRSYQRIFGWSHDFSLFLYLFDLLFGLLVMTSFFTVLFVIIVIRNLTACLIHEVLSWSYRGHHFVL